MRLLLCFCLTALAPALGAQTTSIPANTGICLNAEEASLVQLVNAYRAQNGKPALPATRWLSTTGQYKVWDRIANHAVGGNCNSHSWSGAMPALWQAVCYTPDHAQAAQMWAKPRQISLNVYTGNGFENTADSGAPMTAAQALSQWQSSPAHRDVILNQGSWAGVTFRAMGVGIVGNYAVIWFGDANDPGGAMSACQSEPLFVATFEQ
jgi:hypothetical protein